MFAWEEGCVCDQGLDYEVDSEEEWEEEEPGESLSGTEDEKESEDDYEVDNDLFVPHGYLSEDEENGDHTVSCALIWCYFANSISRCTFITAQGQWFCVLI